MTREETNLKRLALIIDLRATMREWGNPPDVIAQNQRIAEACPLEELESVVARWIRIIEGRRNGPATSS